MKNILITGGTGYLAGRILSDLNKNHNLTVSTRVNKLPLEFGQINKISLNSLKENERNNVLKNFDVIIHTAGLNSYESYNSPNLAYEVNVLNTIDILSSLPSNKIPLFIYFSTAHVYSSPLYGFINEDTICNNIHPYASSHKSAEDVIKFYTQLGRCKGIVLRLSNAVGRPLSLNTKCWELLCNDLCRQGVRHSTLSLNSNGLAFRNFISISNIIEVLNSLINIDFKINYDVFNLGGDSTYTVYEMAELIKNRIEIILGKTTEITINNHDFSASSSEKLNFSNKKIKANIINFNDSLISELDILIEYCNTNF